MEARPLLRRLLAARLGSVEDAEDALQDLWLRVGDLDASQIDQPIPFLCRMATNLATDRRIAAARRGARDGAWDVTYWIPAQLQAEIVVKGSIAIDGVSLTVNGTPADHLVVTLIPHTVAHTQLLEGAVGKLVHLETDLLAKHVRRLVQLGAQNG